MVVLLTYPRGTGRVFLCKVTIIRGAEHPWDLCVLCSVFCVLNFVICVLCSVFHVLCSVHCSVFCVLFFALCTVQRSSQFPNYYLGGGTAMRAASWTPPFISLPGTKHQYKHQWEQVQGGSPPNMGSSHCPICSIWSIFTIWPPLVNNQIQTDYLTQSRCYNHLLARSEPSTWLLSIKAKTYGWFN